MVPYLCEILKVSRSELQAMDYEDVQLALAYVDGRALAVWARSNPHPNWGKGCSD